MKRVLLVISLLAFSCSGLGQAPPKAGSKPAKPVSPFAVYAGDWTATFNASVWLRLRLELQGEELKGAMLHARNVTVTDNGDIKSVSQDLVAGIVSDTAVNPDGLLLTVKDPTSQEMNRYLMKLVSPDNGKAELKMIGMSMPPGMPKPKPWQLTRSGGTPAAGASKPQ